MNLEEEYDKRKLQEKEDNILLEIIKGGLTNLYNKSIYILCIC